jgi:transposase
MSTSPYSLDLRERVIKFLLEGNSQRAAAKIFKLSKTTVSIWYIRYKQNKSYAPKQRLGSKPSINIDSFTKYVEDHPNSTAFDLGKNFSISAAGSRYWLNKLGFSYKKKHSPMWKRTKKNESST